MLELRVAEGCQPTARVLQQLVEQAGIRLWQQNYTWGHTPEAVVCWGIPYTGPLPSLNASAGRLNKLLQAQALAEAGIPTVECYTPAEAARLDQSYFPMLGRQLNHHGGRDIMVAFQPEDCNWRMHAGAQFFTRYIPNRAEYRVWVYRRRRLSVYEKFMAYPGEYKRIGRNYANGFAFRRLGETELGGQVVEVATQAVQALNLDFGAVDVLAGADGRHYVLEVNTAPGVEGPTRQGVVNLADKIARWVELGFPRRNGAQ